MLKVSERNCAGAMASVIGWILLLTALIDGIVIEGYPMIVRFRRKWYPMKTKNLGKYCRRLIHLLNILHIQKLTFLATIFINVLPIQLGLNLFSAEIQYSFASVRKSNLSIPAILLKHIKLIVPCDKR